MVHAVLVRPSPPPLKTFVHQTESEAVGIVLAENAHIAITYSSCFVPSPLTGMMNSEDSDATVAEEPLSGCGSDTEPEGAKSPSLLRLALKLSDERSE